MPVCEHGRCISVARERCMGLECDDGQVCNIDNTCFDRGVENGNGVAVLEILERGVAAMVLVEGGIVWLTADEWNVDYSSGKGTASVVRFDFGSGEVTTLASDIRHDVVPTLQVSGELAFYTTKTGISSVRIDGEGDATQLATREAVFDPTVGDYDAEMAPWAVDSEHVYYAPQFRSPQLRRVRIDGSEDELIHDLRDDGDIQQIVLDETHAYVEVRNRPSGHTELIKLEKGRWLSSTAVRELRDQESSTPLHVSGGFVFFDAKENTAIQAHSLNDGEPITLVTAEMMMPYLYIRSLSDGYVYYSETFDRADKQGSYVARVAIDGGEPERLYSQGTIGNGIVVADDYLYWDEAGRLLRKRL